MSFSSSIPREYLNQMIPRDNADLSDIDEQDVPNPLNPTVVSPSNTPGNFSEEEREEDDDEDVDVFTMDEENVDRKEKGRYKSKVVDSDEDENESRIGRGGSRAYSVSGRVGGGNDGYNYRSNMMVDTGNTIGPLAYGSSLPITIPGKFWPPEDATDSLDTDKHGEKKHVTILPQQQMPNLYDAMRETARSIQAPDNPERLFGERPRRRHQTGENPPPPVSMRITNADGEVPTIICASVTR
ncbi:hypothetical protein L596_003335 [Steinernema carpocapsae]|uniref:Uncharacterized protein n=1 Tax=Steinernema carpocapsae TaxID=34508 RepID=A0A4U8UV63_STECR|nr:hypothetical protein L596_003335 [Steinernema carpocapsae]